MEHYNNDWTFFTEFWRHAAVTDRPDYDALRYDTAKRIYRWDKKGDLKGELQKIENNVDYMTPIVPHVVCSFSIYYLDWRHLYSMERVKQNVLDKLIKAEFVSEKDINLLKDLANVGVS